MALLKRVAMLPCCASQAHSSSNAWNSTSSRILLDKGINNFAEELYNFAEGTNNFAEDLYNFVEEQYLLPLYLSIWFITESKSSNR